MLNGLFGAGGGVVAVPLLRLTGLPEKEAHGTSVAFVLLLCLVTLTSYIIKGQADVAAALPYIPAGLGGAAVGSLFLKKIPTDALRRVFGALIIAGAVRTLFI